jgi:hypothetical protein
MHSSGGVVCPPAIGGFNARETSSMKASRKDRSAITECEPLKSLWLRRDKFHAHFDKHYFFDRARIVKEVLSNGLTLIMRWNF